MGLQFDDFAADTVESRQRWVMRDGIGSDAVAVEAVHWASRNAAYGHVPGWPPAEPDYAVRVALWSDWLSDPAIASVLLTEGESVVAFFTLRAAVEPGLDGARVAEMPTLYVHPDRWRRGYGATLCREAMRRARAMRFRELLLWSLVTNGRAHAFYLALGFQAEDVTKVVEWPHAELWARRYRVEL